MQSCAPVRTSSVRALRPSMSTSIASPALSTILFRTGDKLRDDLRLFETGCFYDCTFLVTNEALTESRAFRCHKIILATASEVFERMLFGPFKEGSVDRDYQIVFSRVSPEVFEIATKFIYGRADQFKDHWMALQVYLFAQEWRILHLLKAVEKFVIPNLKPDFALKTLATLTGHDNPISSYCLRLIQKWTLQVLTKESWLEAPEEVVLKVMKLRSMRMSETRLFMMLVKWGCAQTGGVYNAAAVRVKIDKFVKMIKFCTMSCGDFSSLCSKLVPLSSEEKFKIFHSITQHNANLLPEGFSKSKRPRLFRSNRLYNWDGLQTEKLTLGELDRPVILSFAIDQPHYLAGIKLYSLTSINAGKILSVKCKMFSPENPSWCMVKATFSETVDANCSGQLIFPYPVLLKTGIFYKITVIHEFPATNQPECARYTAGRNCCWQSLKSRKNAVLTFPTDSTTIVDICGLLMAKTL